MRIFVNDKEVVLKSGTSFDYVRENRMFTDSDDYTFDITFPLRDCLQNLQVFGMLFRKDIDINSYTFSARILDREVDLRGIFVITDINDVEVKCQFLAGRSGDNYNNPLDSIYLNEMELFSLFDAPGSDPDLYWQIESYQGQSFWVLCLPWVNNASGNIQNRVKYNSDTDKYEYILPDSDATWDNYRPRFQQVYLSFLIKKIADAIDYDIDLSFITDNDYLKYLIVCNALPQAWDIYELARALPHWTVREFFQELEKLLCCTFDFDFNNKTITTRFNKDVLNADTITVKDVIDDYTEQYEIDSDGAEGKSRITSNAQYSHGDERVWKYWDCPDFVDSFPMDIGGKTFETMNDLKNWIANMRLLGNYKYYGANRLFYCEANGKYYTLCNMETLYVPNDHYYHRMRLFNINIFGASKADDERNTIEMKIVPVAIDEVLENWGSKNYDCMFLGFGDYDEWESPEQDNFEIDLNDNSQSNRIHGQTTFQNYTALKPYCQEFLDKGQDDALPEYYDKLLIGFWNPATMFKRGTIPYPFVDNDVFFEDMSYKHINDNFSLRLDGGVLKTLTADYAVDGKTTYQFKFLTDELLDPQRVYIIHGKRYLCKKLTYSFKESGRSQLVKGEFYRLKEE